MRARLYLDEDVIPELARVLRAHGCDVVSSHELGHLGLTDEAQLERASADRRALLTFNFADYVRIAQDWFVGGRAHAGIIVSYSQYGHRQLHELRRAVLTLLEAVPAEELANAVYVLDQYRSR